MRLASAISLVVLTFGCGRSPDFVSDFGVSYFYEDVEPWDPSLVNQQEGQLFEALTSVPSGRFNADDVRTALGRTRVVVYAGSMCPPGLDGPGCTGVYQAGVARITKYDCPSVSALLHELGHSVYRQMYGSLDRGHEDAELWAAANPVYPGCE